MPRPARFTIRAASALTGINPNTLRAWERRYGLVRPERTPKGYRLYSEDDIQRLRAIRRTMQQGISVGQVNEHLDESAVLAGVLEEPNADAAPVRMVEVSLEELGLSGSTTIRLPGGGGGASSAPNRAKAHDHSLAEFSRQIEQASLRFDSVTLDRAFGRAVGLYSLRHAFNQALAPALTRVGERYLKHAGGVAEEHFLTAFARERLLGALSGLRPLHQPHRVVCACVAGEQHELGLMLLALELALEGVSTLYLGANVPVEALLHACTGPGLRAVALSATLAAPLEQLADLQPRLQHVAPRAKLFVGGPAANKQKDAVERTGAEVLPLDPSEASHRLFEVASRR
ncbi:MAG: MerR family transcriptional regulator [Candidatus Eisenbacteria bacterium]